MAIYQIDDQEIVPVNETTFSEANLRERADLQPLLRDNIAIIDEDLLVVSEEFGNWEDSRRRVDLLAVDRDGNIVVIELKRTSDSGHSELQAIRYAAMVSALTAEQVIEIFGRYLESRGRDDDPREALLSFLDWSDVYEDSFGRDARIILISADFSKEVTTAALWVNEKGIDLRCVRIKPYRLNDSVLLDVQQVVPLPEAADYQVQVREKRRQEQRSRKSSADFTRYDVHVGDRAYENQWKRNAILMVVKHLVGVGRTPEEIASVLKPFKSRSWYSVEGEVKDPGDFVDRALDEARTNNRSFDSRRWHTNADDLFIMNGRTYVFSNQWGNQWEPAMEALRAKYADAEITWEPTAVE